MYLHPYELLLYFERGKEEHVGPERDIFSVGEVLHKRVGIIHAKRVLEMSRKATFQ